jgi:signal peptidase II
VRRRYIAFTIAAALSVLADQITKVMARANLVPGHATTFIDGFWDWLLSFNTGVAFGLFRNTPGARIFLTIIGLAACAVLVLIVKRTADRARNAAALGLVLGGALGNLIDRIAFGKVTDFVSWRVGDFHWPQFNVADASLVVGVVLLVLLDIGKKPAKKI